MKLAVPPAKPPIRALRTRSFLPDADLVMPEVKALRVRPTTTEELAAAAYPYKMS